jgi:hypothetical protein
VAPAGPVGGRVDGEFGDDVGVHAGVDQGWGGSAAPVRSGQRDWPGVSRPGMGAEDRAGGGLGAGGQVGGAAGDLQLPVVVVAAQDQYLGGVDAADDSADDGLDGDPGPEFLPAADAGLLGLVGVFGDYALHAGGGVAA